ncbi:hypothetical protein HQ576_05855, partial [bacterium]|nr:hypothetical protein [bacterium]
QALDALSDPTALAEQQARAADAGARRYNWSQAERELLALYASFQPTAPH